MSWRISLYILMLTILIACSKEQEVLSSFEGQGQYWKAQINPEVKMMNGKKKFIITYQYLGKVEDIKNIERIVFVQGTLMGTEVVNLYDRGYKAELMKKGQYQEEYEETYGIIIEDLKNKKTTEFVIEYYFLEDEDLNIFKAINKDRMNIQIHWEIDNKELKDKIDIQESR